MIRNAIVCLLLVLLAALSGCVSGYEAALKIPSPPPFTVTAKSFVVLPYYTSSTYQVRAAQTSTNCNSTSDGTIDNNGNTGTYNGNTTTNCTSTTTPAQYNTITWAHVFNYNTVTGGGYQYLIECEANVRWSGCSHLIPGEQFTALIRNGVMWITAVNNGGKVVHVKYNVLSQSPE